MDGDTIGNDLDLFPRDPTEWYDIDGDGIGDNSDIDRDGDGIRNDYEVQVGTDPSDKRSVPLDLDRDGIPDKIDDDMDGDGYLNENDAFPMNPSEWADMDGDGIGDNTDLDVDGDGISNEYELRLGTDPRDAASTPPDMDGDAIPDALDSDIDGDEIPNDRDRFPRNPREWADTDNDGRGDNSDQDIDGDGIINNYEILLNFDPFDASSVPPDSDGDGVPDALDDDRDNDGYTNSRDVFPDDPAEWADFDGDGIGDNSDPDTDGDGFTNVEEIREKTDPWNKADYPDHEPPVIGKTEWLKEQQALSGMAYDDGLGIRTIRLESPAGDVCPGFSQYTGHFMVPCPTLRNSTEWTLIIEDKRGNRATEKFSFKGE